MLNVGDEVVIRDIEFLRSQENVWPSCVIGMWKYAGQNARVTSAGAIISERVRTCRIDIDEGEYYWNENWFEPVATEIPNEVFEAFDGLL